MESVCGCCVASYCSCRGSGAGNRCVIHSVCAFCSGPISGGENVPRAVKRKLAMAGSPENLMAGYSRGENLMFGSSRGENIISGFSRGDNFMAGCSRGENLNDVVEALRSEREALYLELEEERNAAAIAATETLAMITRLQEEKAAVQMEASQYKRMVEERSRYDQEAIGMLNEILARQEEEKLALSREIEVYRSRKSSSAGGTDEEFRTPLDIDPEGNLSRNLLDSFDEARSSPPEGDRVSPPKGGRVSLDTPPKGGRVSLEDESLRVHGKSSCSPSESEELFMQKYWRSSKSSTASRDLRRAYDRLGKPDGAGEGSSYRRNDVNLHSRRNDELLELNRRLQALEADRGFLQQSYGGGGGGGRSDDLGILEEISQQLRQIQALDRNDDGKELSEASFVFSFKGFFSFNGLRQSLNSNINRLACMFLRHSEGGGLDHHHHVGLSHLLESSHSRRSPRGGISRGVKFESPPQLLSSGHTIHRQNVHWPMDARGRSETAFSGWDY